MYLDYGLDFYAPQTFLDENGQRTMLAGCVCENQLKMNHGQDYIYCQGFEYKMIMFISQYIHMFNNTSIVK